MCRHSQWRRILPKIIQSGRFEVESNLWYALSMPLLREDAGTIGKQCCSLYIDLGTWSFWHQGYYLVPSSSFTYFSLTIPVIKCTEIKCASSVLRIVWLRWIMANICQPSHPATYISFSQLIATATRATRNILSYHLLPSLLKRSIRMREWKRDFVLLNVQVCACLFFCAYSKTQAGKQCDSKPQQTTGLYISTITVWNSKPHT